MPKDVSARSRFVLWGFLAGLFLGYLLRDFALYGGLGLFLGAGLDLVLLRRRKDTEKDNVNSYSQEWYATFLSSVEEPQTAKEVSYIKRQFPLPEYAKLLDVGCGPGRHAVPLAQSGYCVTGIDKNAAVLKVARQKTPELIRETTHFLQLDQRELHTLDERFDGVICLWQSFGFFEPKENQEVLQQLNALLRPQGRALFDLYNAEALSNAPARKEIEHDGRRAHITQSLVQKFWEVRISYDGSKQEDRFRWRVYDFEEFAALAKKSSFRVLHACTYFEEARKLSDHDFRMQVLLEKVPTT